MTTIEIALTVLGGILGIAVFAYLFILLAQAILFPWMLLLHMFSLGTIPMPEFEANPIKMLKDLFTPRKKP